MVGDIFGKTWTSSAPAPSGSASSIGIVNKNPNLFGDLVTSALGQGKTNSNVPLKNAKPSSTQMAANKSPYSMGNLADSLPKTGNSVKNGAGWGSSENFGGSSGGYQSSTNNINGNNNNKSPNLGGPSMRSMTGGGSGGAVNSNKDPFGSLFDFGSKPSGSLNSGGKSNKARAGDDAFGDFQNAPKSSTSSFPSTGFTPSNASSGLKMDDFGMPTNDFTAPNQPTSQSSGAGDPFNMFFSTSSGSGIATTTSGGGGEQQFSEVDDWGIGSEFGGGGDDSGGATTELEGLPPPPAGVTASAAKNKGIDNQKQGQYADAIKWLSWAVILMEKSGDKAGSMDVLSCRASCYKEVGEYKKAVADCSKVLEQDDANVSVLVQRALLYESMEKYKLGAEDLRTVLKIDPGNRIARSTIHRLNKMAAG